MDPYSLSPEEQQRIMAETLRGQAALKQASGQAGQYDNLAAISQLINNKDAAAAAGAAQRSAQARYKPQSLGAQGFALPGTGEFAASPMFIQEKLEGRAQQRGLQQERLTQAAQLAQDRAALQQQMLQQRQDFQASQADQNRALRMTIAGMSGSKKGGDAEGKTLPYGAIEKMTKKEGVRDSYAGLVSSFKPEWAGSGPVMADIENAVGSFFPKLGKGPQSNWWKNYAEQSNIVRNELFGSALTAPEKKAFDAASIQPGMDAGQIELRLKQQAAAADSAYRKNVQAARASGYNTSGFDAGLDAPGVQATSPGGQGPRGGLPKAVGAGLQLPPGFKIIGEVN